VKFRISTILILLGIFVSAAHAQTQSNCCEIQVGGVQTSGANGSVPPDSSGPGGVYIATQTETYPIACVNLSSGTAKPCNSTSVPNNVVTATGAGKNVNGIFVQCNPTFQTTLSQSSPTSGTAASFKNQGTGYTAVDATGTCTPQTSQPFAISTCIVVTCPTTSSCACDPRLKSCPSGCSSPILIDISGKGFVLTDATDGVKFDISGTGTPIQMGWTASGADNAFLALPSTDGLVHSGKQLFGNYTPQPASATPNGFAALAVYDDPKYGGNGDGIIDARDAVFASLRLWIDANHDGISQPEELHTLPSLGVNSISLTYTEDRRTDQYGNVFRYHAQVNPGDATSTGRIAYDVFFVRLAPTNTINAKNAGACQVPTNKVGMLTPVGSLR